MPDKQQQQFTVKDIVLRLEKHLVGEDGNGGVVRELQKADKENREYVDERHKENQAAIALVADEVDKTNKRLDKLTWMGLGFLFAIEFLTGSGFASLDHLMKAWPILFGK